MQNYDKLTARMVYEAAMPHIRIVLDDIGAKTGPKWIDLSVRCTTKRKGSAYRFRGTVARQEVITSEIVFSVPQLRHYMAHGYAEYKTLRYLVQSGYTGTMCLWLIVTHELAHFIHHSRWLQGETKRTRPHDRYFQAVYAELLRDYPYETMASLYAPVRDKLGMYRDDKVAA